MNWIPLREIALHGSDVGAIAFSRDLLRKNRPLRIPGHPISRLLRIHKVTAKLYREPGEAGIFAFNAGFLHHILPPSLNSPANATPFTEPYYSGDSNHRMSDKFARLRTALYDRKDMAVSDETVEDTVLDLATYAVLLLAYRRGAK